MKCSTKHSRTNEKGNALWFILLAVGLLAALGIAVTRSSDSTEQSGNIENLRIQASQIMRFSTSLEQTIQQMSQRGVSENDLDFENSVLGATYNNPGCDPILDPATDCMIFDVEGGGMSFNAMTQVQNWEITGGYRVQNAGTTDNDLIIQARISRNLCTEINRMAGITPPPTDDEDLLDTVPFVGSFADATVGAIDVIIGNNAAELAGEYTGCRQNSGGEFWFYHVLLAR